MITCRQGNLLQATSRILKEEVTFDTEKVTSVDWVTYPILRHTDVPDKIDIVRNGVPLAPCVESAGIRNEKVFLADPHIEQFQA